MAVANAMLLGKIPVDSIVRLKKTGEFARIVGKNQLQNRPESFLNYYMIIENKSGIWCAFDDTIELECLPTELDSSN
jgi:hypothetical protein